MKPLALDLCCGKGGWTNGLLAAGWDVIGVDIEDMGGYQGHLVFADVREIAKDVQAYFPALKFDLVVASPPCQEFSRLSLPFFAKRKRAGEKPDISIWKSCQSIATELGAPLVLENVRGAQEWISRAAWSYGSYYFWGTWPKTKNSWELRPPNGCPRKGYDLSFKKDGSGKRVLAGPRRFSSRSPKRKEASAIAAMIPLELSTWIGECFYPPELRKTKTLTNTL